MFLCEAPGVGWAQAKCPEKANLGAAGAFLCDKRRLQPGAVKGGHGYFAVAPGLPRDVLLLEAVKGPFGRRTGWITHCPDPL